MPSRRRNERNQRRRNSQGFIDTYNQANPQAPYGSSAYAQNYDPTQPFGTPQAVQPRVPDWAETQARIGANRNVALSNAQAQYDTNAINRDFGQGGMVDPNNPYARASLLEQSFKQSQLGTTNSMAAQGQLYSGATQNAQNENTRQYSIGKNTLQNQYRDSLQGVKQNQLSAYANAGSAVSDEAFQALLRALGR